VRKDAPEETPAGGNGATAEAATKRGPRNVEAAKQSSQRGELLYKQNKFGEAAKQFKQSIDNDSGDSNWPAYLGRGSSLLKMGKVKEAIKDLEKSHSANPNNPAILYMLGCAYGQKGDKPKALDYLGRAVSAGYPLHAVVEHDADLTHALGDEPQFKELVKSSREKNSRGTAGSGNTGP
jgi:tetratricopeptide (TPR) repeat protein